MNLFFYIVTSYLGVTALAFFLVNWYIRIGTMTEEDFDYVSKTMWIPVMNLIIAITAIIMIIGNYFKKIEKRLKKRTRKSKPTVSFRDRLFGIKRNGYYVEKVRKPDTH